MMHESVLFHSCFFILASPLLLIYPTGNQPGRAQGSFLLRVKGFPCHCCLLRDQALGFCKHLGLRIDNRQIRNTLMSIVLRLCQMWPLQLSFFHELYAKHLGISPSCYFLYYLFYLYLSIAIGYSFVHWHLSTGSSCFHLIILPLLPLHDLSSSVSLSGLITTGCLQHKWRETNGKQIQSAHCPINQVVWCSPKPPPPDNIPSPCVFCTLQCADGEPVTWVSIDVCICTQQCRGL